MFAEQNGDMCLEVVGGENSYDIERVEVDGDEAVLTRFHFDCNDRI